MHKTLRTELQQAPEKLEQVEAERQKKENEIAVSHSFDQSRMTCIDEICRIFMPPSSVYKRDWLLLNLISRTNLESWKHYRESLINPRMNCRMQIVLRRVRWLS
jgi:hypothetical protein